MVIVDIQTNTVLKTVSATLQKGGKHEKKALSISIVAVKELLEETEM